LASLIAPNTRVEVVTEGLEGWIAAPLWRHDPALGRGYLLFSQLDRHRLWRWEEGGGAFTIGRSLFLEHAGCHRSALAHFGGGDCSQQTGVLGMANAGDLLVLCEGANRRMTRVELNGSFTVLASTRHLPGQLTPFAAVYSPTRGLFFTGAPHVMTQTAPATEASALGEMGEHVGDENQERIVTKEGLILHMSLSALGAAQSAHAANGGSAETLLAGLTRPTGLAFSPDGLALYVAEDDPVDPHWRRLDLAGAAATEGKVFARPPPGEAELGGLAVDSRGNVYAAFKGGVLVFDKDGRLRGTIDTGPASGVTLADGFLFITGNGRVLRVKTNSKPASPV